MLRNDKADLRTEHFKSAIATGFEANRSIQPVATNWLQKSGVLFGMPEIRGINAQKAN